MPTAVVLVVLSAGCAPFTFVDNCSVYKVAIYETGALCREAADAWVDEDGVWEAWCWPVDNLPQPPQQ